LWYNLCMFSMKSLLNYKLFFSGIIAAAIILIPNTSNALTITPRIEIEADPGTTVKSTLKITNEEKQSRTFYLRYENFNAQDETGNPTFLPRWEDLSTWIKAPLSITLGPGETFDMPIEIVIPANAEPGGHYTAIFFMNKASEVNDDSDNVALASKLGSLVLLRVRGDFVQDANILEFGTTNKQKFFSQLPIQFYYRFQNGGDDHQKPVGDIQITNIFGSSVKALNANPVEGSVLAKSVRRFTSSWIEKGGDYTQAPVIDLPKADKMAYWDAVNYQARHFTMGRYKAVVKLAFGSKELKSDRAEFVFYIIPWQLLSVAIPLFIILLFVLRFVLKRYNRYIIAKAQRNRNS
jgi:hypothetical protein